MLTCDRVTLTRAEERLASYLAEARYTENRKRGIPDNLRSPRDPLEAEREGISAELAFCRSQNIYPDLSNSIRRGGFDCVLQPHPHSARGLRLDVKSVRESWNNLMTTPNKKHEQRVDAFVLVCGKTPHYEVVGWTPFADLVNDARLVDLGYGPTYLMPRNNLFPIGTLYDATPHLIDDQESWASALHVPSAHEVADA